MGKKAEIIEAQKYGLSLIRYREFARLNLLKKCVPPEGATCGSAQGIIASLLKQYKIDDLMYIKDPEHKKGKELFLCSLFAHILRHLIKNEIAICIPLKDCGIDIYIRELDDVKKQIILRPIQVCEFPERYIKRKTKSFTEGVFNFIKTTKFKYAKSKDALLIWLEPEEHRKLDIEKLRKLFKKEKDIPFGQIIIFGRNKDLFNIVCVYSNDPQYYYSFEYDWRNDNIITPLNNNIKQ